MLHALLLISLVSAEEPATTTTTDADTDVKTGWGWAALPTPNYTSSNGIGYGAFGALYNYGPEGPGDDPYRGKIAVQFYQTTKWYMDHFVNLDFPRIAGTNLRWDMKLGWEAWTQAKYFGRGNFLPRYEEPPTDTYNMYALNSLRVFTNLRIPVTDDYQVLVNYYGRRAWPRPYEDSLLMEQQPTGYDDCNGDMSMDCGNMYSQLTAGMIRDTRDQEPSPTSGDFSEISVRASSFLLGSSYDFVGLNFTERHWFSLAPGGRLVLANRFIADYRVGDVPFYDDWVMGGSQFVQIGGSLSMRGLDDGRYRGDLILLDTPELRWTWLAKKWGTNTLDIMLVPFVDLCRVWAFEVDEPDALTHVHASGGLGNRFAWNKNFLVRLDIAWGLEEYISEDLTVDTATPEDVTRAPNMGFYLVFDHPY